MSLVRFYVAELKTRDRELERLRAENEALRKTRREVMDKAFAAGRADAASGAPSLLGPMLDRQNQVLDAIERELDAREKG